MTEIINKIHGHSQRETRAHSEDGVVEEGSSWVILRNNGVLEKVVASKDPCEGEKYQPTTEEWINLGDVTSILFSECESTNVDCIMEVYAPPSRFILKAESAVERCQWVSCFRRILAKSGRESIISGDLNSAHSESHARRRATCTTAKAIFCKSSVDVQTTYYIRPDEVNCFSSEESLEDVDQTLCDSGASSIDSGVGCELHTRESYSYLQLLPGAASQDNSNADLASVPHTDYDFIRQKRLVFNIHSLPQCELPPCQDSDDESDLYCDIKDASRRSTHIYDSIIEYSKEVDLPFETIDENGKEDSDGVSEQREDSPLSSVSVQQEAAALPLVLATTTDGYTAEQDSQMMNCMKSDMSQAVPEQYVDIAIIIERKETVGHHNTSGRSVETSHADHLSPLPDSSDVQCSAAEESMNQKELALSTELSRKEVSPSSEMNQKELPSSPDEVGQQALPPSAIQEDEASQRELSPSPIQEDDYIPMKSAGLADDIQAFREEVAVRPQVDLRSTSSLTPEQAYQQRQLSATPIYAPSPPPLPPRKYTKRTYSPLPQSEIMRRSGNRLQRCRSNSSMDSLDSESSHLTHRGSFRNVRHLLGSLIHETPSKGGPEKFGEATEKRKMIVYKTAEILNLDGGISLSGSQQYNSLRHKKKEEHVNTLGRSDTASPPLLLTKKGLLGSTRHRPALSNVFDTTCNLSDARSMGSSSSVSCAEEDVDEPFLPPRTSSFSGRVKSSSLAGLSFDTFGRTRSQSVRLQRSNTTGTLLSKKVASEPQCQVTSSLDNQTEDGERAETGTGEVNKTEKKCNAQPPVSPLLPRHAAKSNGANHYEQVKQPDESGKSRSETKGSEQLKQSEDAGSSSKDGCSVLLEKEQGGTLPPGWDRVLDPERGIHYYFNLRTRDITWNWEEVFQLAKRSLLVSGWT